MMKRSFLPRLDDIKANTNRLSEDVGYITKKQNEFRKLFDISKEKQLQDLELPEYIAASPTKKAKHDEYEIPDLDSDENELKKKVEKETDVDEDDPDYENVEEEDDEEIEKPKKKRCTSHYPRTAAASIRLGISTFALCVLIWAYNMGKKISNLNSKVCPFIHSVSALMLPHSEKSSFWGFS